jgi:hypothetical protein
MKPKPDWLSLAKAVFKFGIADEKATGPVGTAATAFSLPRLIDILKEESGANHVEIDPDQCTFTFQFSGDRSVWGGKPWTFLEDISRSKLAAHLKEDTETLFNKNGFVTISDAEAAEGVNKLTAIRAATGLVWRQFILREFNRAIARNGVSLFARIESPLAPFEELPADVWPLLSILDWQTAIARTPEGRLLYSIHAQGPKASISTVRDETAAIRELAIELRRNPQIKRAEAESWCAMTGFTLSRRAFQFRVWPRAREQAGLGSAATPGRKAKSLR